MSAILNITPEKILAWLLKQIGDVLLATPTIKRLKERFPQASLHILTEKKCAAVLHNNPGVVKIWRIDKQTLQSITAIGWYAKVGRQGFDLIVGLQQLPRCKWVVSLPGAPIQLTFTPPWYKPLYTLWCDMETGYAAKAKASVLTPMGIKWNTDSLEHLQKGFSYSEPT